MIKYHHFTTPIDLGDDHQRKRRKEREEYYSDRKENEIMPFAAT